MGPGASCLPDSLLPFVKLQPVLLDHARCYYKINKKLTDLWVNQKTHRFFSNSALICMACQRQTSRLMVQSNAFVRYRL